MYWVFCGPFGLDRNSVCSHEPLSTQSIFWCERSLLDNMDQYMDFLDSLGNRVIRIYCRGCLFLYFIGTFINKTFTL